MGNTKIAVLGATGGVGSHVVKLALAQGHRVVALARKVDGFEAHPSLETVPYDVLSRDADSLSGAIEGASMVLSCLGNRRGEGAIVANGTATLMAAMAKAGVPRMAMISSIGIGDSSMQLLRLGFGGWIFSAIFATILRRTKHDLNAAEALIIGQKAGYFSAAVPHSRPDGVACVAVRPAGLSDAPSTGQYDVALVNGTVGSSVAREDVAKFMLSLVNDKQYDNGAVSVGGNAPRTGH